MHSQTKTSSTKLPEVHRVGKELNPNLRPEKQHAMPQKRYDRKAAYRSGKSKIEKKA